MSQREAKWAESLVKELSESYQFKKHINDSVVDCLSFLLPSGETLSERLLSLAVLGAEYAVLYSGSSFSLYRIEDGLSSIDFDSGMSSTYLVSNIVELAGDMNYEKRIIDGKVALFGIKGVND